MAKRKSKRKHDHDFEARTTTVPATAKMCKGALMYKRGEI